MTDDSLSPPSPSAPRTRGPAPAPREERAQRSATALRANLARRKAQIRARAGDPAATTTTDDGGPESRDGEPSPWR